MTILSKSAAMALCCVVPLLIAWEWHWREEGYPRTPDATKHLWAENRGKVKGLASDDVVIIGSSRVLFDIQIYEWENITGRRPVQLAMPGATPMPVFQDIAEKTTFNGTLVVGVTPGLFFRNGGPGRGSWDRPAANVEHYYQRTYAQRFNYWVSKPLQCAFAFLQSEDLSFYNELDLATLIDRIPLKGRVEVDDPFPLFRFEDENRNVTMWDRVTSDTAYAGMIKQVWSGGGPRKPPDSTEVAATRETVISLAKKYTDLIRARGGDVVFVRCPSTGWYIERETEEFPRRAFWDALLASTGTKGYHFQDYEFMSKYEPPEWSHLATPDAKVFTRDLVRQMLADGVLKSR